MRGAWPETGALFGVVGKVCGSALKSVYDLGDTSCLFETALRFSALAGGVVGKAFCGLIGLGGAFPNVNIGVHGFYLDVWFPMAVKLLFRALV